ncbi:S-adenosyl-L-methionine-dependent methyltransferase, partial [Wilcoxina mikolae CBS 423.85]
DPRLSSIVSTIPDIFTNKKILDVGCNSGHITVSIALNFNPLCITAIDRDPTLISKAKSHLSFRWSRLGPGGEIDYFPASSVERGGHVPYPPRSEGFPHNVFFVHQDFLEGEVEGEEEGGYGVVMMLSVVKWIHLQGGDVGLEKVLRKTYRVLEEGGYFVLEVQGWESYAAAVKKNPRLREVKEGLKWRPEGFGEVLEALGFVRVGRIENEGRREIGVWRKG